MAVQQLPIALVPQQPDQDPAPRPPRVSIGVPVYNGEAYLEVALRSLMGQTFDDIEICVSDNASTDRTEQICRQLMIQDPRIRYSRASENRGLVWNHRRALAMAKGEFFMFAPHDDWFAPEYLDLAVRALDADPGTSYAHAMTVLTDPDGIEVGIERTRQRMQAVSPSLRFWDILTVQGGINLYGLTRRHLMGRIGKYVALPRSERIVLAELALWGPFALLPAGLYFRRIHPGQATTLRRNRKSELRRLDPAKAHGWQATDPVMLAKYVLHYVAAASRAPMSVRERILTFCYIGRWMLAKVPPFRLSDPRTTTLEIDHTGPGLLPDDRAGIGY